MQSTRKTRDDGPGSLAAEAYQRLHREIVNGTLAPGEKLLIARLCKRYGIGLSPVREALNRLAGERLVRHSEQRGFMVAPLSEQDLEDILRARWWLNEIGLRRSIEYGDAAWEERVILALHRMSRTPLTLDGDPVRRNPEWETAHRQLHASLVSACGSTWLEQFCEQLFHAFDRYRQLGVVTSPSDRKAEHTPIVEAAVSRRTEEAVRLLKAHYDKTERLVRRQLLPATSSHEPSRRTPQQRRTRNLEQRRPASKSRTARAGLGD